MFHIRTNRPLVVLMLLVLSLSWLVNQDEHVVAQSAIADPASVQRVPTARVEVAAARTATSRTYREGNVYQTNLYTAPVNYQDASGAWQPIDNTLVPSAVSGYAYENHANRYTVRFPKDIATAPIRIELGRSWIALRPLGASGTATVTGQTATYAGNGYSLAYLAGSNELKETVTLQSATAPSTYRYSLQTSPDLTSRSGPSGSIQFISANGVVQFALDRPWAMDASGPASVTSAVTDSLSETNGATTLTVTLSPSWLQAKARRFPVILDPTLQVVGSATLPDDRDCPMYGGYPTTSYCSNTSLYTGEYSGFPWRSLLHFSPNAVPPDATVVASSLHVYLASSAYATTGSTVNVYPLLNGGWTSYATWNTYDGVDVWNAPGGDYGSTAVGSLNVPYGAAAGYQTWQLAVSQVQGWVAGTSPNDGLEMMATNESVQNLISWYSATEGSGYAPYVTVTYTLGTGDEPWFTMDNYSLSDQLNAAVNVANGNLLVDQSVFSMAGRGLSVGLDASYNSLNRGISNPDFANGWDASVGQDVGLYALSGGYTYQGPGGTVDWFAQSGSSYVSPPGMDGTLVHNSDGSFTLTDHASQEKLNFNSSGVLTSDVDRSGNTLTYNYNNVGYNYLASITDTQSRTTSVAYTVGQTGSISQVTDPASRTYGFGYTGGQLTSYTDPTNHTAYFAYGTGTGSSPTNALVQITDPNGNVTQFSYTTDSYGIARVASVTRVLPSGTPNPPCSSLACTTTYTYNPGNTVVTDPNGHQTIYRYDSNDRVTSVTDAANHTTSYTWTADNHVHTVTSPRGYTTTHSYDSNNNPTSVQTPTGLTWSCAYTNTTWIYQPSSCTDEQGHTTQYGYDTAGRLSSIINAANHTTSIHYNTDGTVQYTTDANGHTSNYAYFTSGTSIGLLQKVTYPSVTGGLGAQSMTYDNANRPYEQTDGKGQLTTFTYDNLDRLTEELYADGTAQFYQYDLDGNQAQLDDHTSTTDAYTNSTYNALNELTNETLPTGTQVTCPGTSTSASSCYTYDPAGNMLTKTDAGGTVSYSYNTDDTLYSVADPVTGTGNPITFAYNADGAQTAINYPGGTTETTGYDTADAVTSVVGTRTSGTLTSATYSFTNPATNKYTSMWYSVTDAQSRTTSYTYDALNRLTGGTQKNSGGSTLATYSYGHDYVGNMTSINGNTATYNADNELTGYLGHAYTHDGNGNLTSTATANSYLYNAQDQTTSITPSSGSAIAMKYTGAGQASRIGNGQAVYQYDANGMGSTAATSTTTPTYFTTTPDGQVLSERIPGGQTGCSTGQGTYCGYYYLYDGQGSVSSLVSSTGTPVDTYTYDPYGMPTETHPNNAPNVANPYAYIGAVWDSQESMYAMGDRYYDPSVGTFSQSDPMGGGFGYADGDPINLSDPTGAFPTPYEIGKELEDEAQEAFNLLKNNKTFEDPSFLHGRRPDIIGEVEEYGKVVIEVKNLATVGGGKIARQLADYAKLAEALDSRLVLYIKPGTEIVGKVAKVVKDFYVLVHYGRPPEEDMEDD